ncbi:hypothetical protein L211DRAFT_891319 [Terfezia boudieri ATCC MYA-4762]|uniref:Uncharacterized protein n=1 Tax=Terfezia boudieri ATCC MYA-4762 TaxID=1051890 RepID=A0A3N4LYG2_9PEZI|nr:hypothetical protein L211DRAFT_891319 [Terfezia boudieri ATCC MYA-4762]
MSSPPAKKPKLSLPPPPATDGGESDDDLDTDTKLGILSSLFSLVEHEVLLEVLITAEGSLETAQKILGGGGAMEAAPQNSKRGIASSSGAQASLSSYLPAATSSSSTINTSNTSNTNNTNNNNGISSLMPRPQKGKPLLLFKPEHVAALTPCTLITGFLQGEVANELLLELVREAQGFVKKGSREVRFVLWGKEVWSRHTSALYVRGEGVEGEGGGYVEEGEDVWYTYSGMKEQKKRVFTERMERVTELVEEKVREVISERISPPIPLEMGRKKYESPHPWKTNAAIVNCYDGGAESVGWHADQVTYLGPMTTIASVSLGVGREFGLKRQSAAEGEEDGVVKVWLPHNSLLIMEAGTQEEWKHCIYPAPSVSTHPLSGSKRINITYRYYRPSLAPKYLPRCKCEPEPLPGVLRAVMDKRSGNYGRYFWSCQGAYQGRGESGEGCGWFEWAEWDAEGEVKGWRERRKEEREKETGWGRMGVAKRVESDGGEGSLQR